MSASSSSPQTQRIALMLSSSEIFGREIIAGVGAYMGQSRTDWDLVLDDELYTHPEMLGMMGVDGVIADFNSPGIRRLVTAACVPAVAVGSVYAGRAEYPQGIPYVATADHAIVRLAYEHLASVGISHVCLYSMPVMPGNRWAQMRENAFREMCGERHAAELIFRGDIPLPLLSGTAMTHLVEWLQHQPRPFGVVAVNDVRARQVLQACLAAGLAVPEEVAIVGIDDDPLAQTITRIPLSSVRQDGAAIGRIAAGLLHRQLCGTYVADDPVFVDPVGIKLAASSQHQNLCNPFVMRARCFIRQFAAQGIKTEQVADHVGVARSTLDAYFRKEFGHTVHDEILRTKLSRAQQMLLEGAASGSNIAEKCGFTTLQYMHAVFRRELGCTPKEYQMSYQKTQACSSEFGIVP